MEGKQKSKFKSYKNLYGILYPQLNAIAYYYVKDIEASNEIVQEIFLNAWADYIEFDNDISDNDITEFFYNAVVDKCVDNIKAKRTKGIARNKPTDQR
jgi:DNA-directed RNA polymerase specialized sigma24 family protein